MYKLIVIIFMGWTSLSWATDYYVDKNASGSNNGTNWTNAWESFSAINWSSIAAGDIIYISGGSDSTIYYETLSIGASGAANNPITIKNSSDAEHNGRVIIDGGNNTRTDGINISYHDYITIKGFEIRRSLRGVYLHYNTEVITLDSLTIYDFYGQAGVKIIGGDSNVLADGAVADSVTIKNCSIVSFVDLDGQTDGVYAQMCANTSIYNSYIHIRNRSLVNNHSDGIQGHRTRGWKIYDNVVICDSNVQGMAIILGAEDVSGSPVDSVIIYNNYFYMGGIWYSGAPYVAVGNTRWYSQNNMPPAVIIHNTFVSRGPYVEGFRLFYPATMKNNIFAQYGDGNGQYNATLRNSYGTAHPVDGLTANLWYREWNDIGFSGSYTGNGNTGTPSGWSSWVNTYGGTGVNADPLFLNEIGGDDAELQANSPAIDQGENLQALIESMGFEWIDILGNPRDSSPTIGAYEYEGRPDITPPEVTGAVLLDPVTLKIMFSETLEESTAEDENNYSISNNIDIFNASLSGSEVTLQTTTHSPGSYIVTVVNVEDLAGNPISQSNNAEYSLIPPDSLIMFLVENVQGVTQEPGHTPLKTIDGLGALSGDPDSRWAAEPMPEELIFDLGLNKTVCKTKLSFYNWNAGRVYSYSISISNDNNNWITAISQATSASNEEWTIDEFPPVDARYVKVHFINNNQSDWAGLWEGEIWGISSTLVDPTSNGLPNEFSLHQNYPNPFNPSTTIEFSVPKLTFITLKIFDILGNEVATLVNAKKPVGSYEVKFDATGLPSGIYFYRLQANEFAQVKKLILLK